MCDIWTIYILLTERLTLLVSRAILINVHILLCQFEHGSCGDNSDQQISPHELQSDAEQLFAIVECDAEFEGVMQNLEHHTATEAVYEAVRMLHAAPEPDEKIEYQNLSPEVGQSHIQYVMVLSHCPICMYLLDTDD